MMDLPASAACVNTDWSKDTVVDRVVQEQYLRRLNEDGCQRKKSVVDKNLNAAPQNNENHAHETVRLRNIR